MARGCEVLAPAPAVAMAVCFCWCLLASAASSRADTAVCGAGMSGGDVGGDGERNHGEAVLSTDLHFGDERLGFHFSRDTMLLVNITACDGQGRAQGMVPTGTPPSSLWRINASVGQHHHALMAH